MINRKCSHFEILFEKVAWLCTDLKIWKIFVKIFMNFIKLHSFIAILLVGQNLSLGNNLRMGNSFGHETSHSQFNFDYFVNKYGRDTMLSVAKDNVRR